LKGDRVIELKNQISCGPKCSLYSQVTRMGVRFRLWV